ESLWAADKKFDPAYAHLEYVMEGRKGEMTTKLKVYDPEERREIDGELAKRTVEFMQRNVKANKPFFVYVPLTMPHFPTEPSKKFAGSTGNGPFADMLAEMDFNVGTILDSINDLKISDNTIVIFTSDNGPEDVMPWRGWAGPWSGTSVTAMEGSLRVPFIIRWPEKIPAGRVSNEMVHVTDIFTTLAKFGGADIPTDRAIDGVDESAFFLGKSEKSTREFFPVFQAIGATGPQLYAMKWRNFKVHMIWQVRKYDVPEILSLPLLIDLYDNPQESREETIGESSIEKRGWVLHTLFANLAKFQATMKTDPPVPVGASDPYVPPVASGAESIVKLPAIPEQD
ncbi:MAG: sulfatase-like hydrolase/transferase, partial [Dongiaceae bacterium]